MENLADHLIFKALRNDDRQALNQLFSHHYRALCHFAHSYLHDPMLAEEVVSDVFFNLWVKRKTLKITGSIKPIIRNFDGLAAPYTGFRGETAPSFLYSYAEVAFA